MSCCIMDYFLCCFLSVVDFDSLLNLGNTLNTLINSTQQCKLYESLHNQCVFYKLLSGSGELIDNMIQLGIFTNMGFGTFFFSHNIILPISFSKTVNLLSTYCFSLLLRHLLYYLFVKACGPSLKSATTEVSFTLVHSRIRDSHQTQPTYSQSAIAAWAFMRWKLFHASLSDVFLLSCFAAGVFSGPPFPSQLPHIPALFCLLTPTCLRRLLQIQKKKEENGEHNDTGVICEAVSC